MNTSVVLALLVLSATATQTQARNPPIGINNNFAYIFSGFPIFVFQRIAIAIWMDARPKDAMQMASVIANVQFRD